MFDRFSFLWKTDMQAEYDKFMKTNPSLEAVEVELKKYDDIEQQITVVAPVHNIGCLSIETTRLKTALRCGGGSVGRRACKLRSRVGPYAVPGR